MSDDIKRVITGCKSKDRQYNGQMKQDKKNKQWSIKYYNGEKNNVSNTNPLKTGREFECSGRVSNSCSISIC